MNFLNIFEDRVSTIFGAARAPFSFKKLAKQAAHEMEDQTLVVNGANTAPALYTILISADDDAFMAPYYPQLAREVSDLVKAQAEKKHYAFVGEPLVRFMIDPELKPGKFSVFAENVDAATLGRLYEEERAYQQSLAQNFPSAAAGRSQQAPMPRQQVSQPQAAAAENPARQQRPIQAPQLASNRGFTAAPGASAANGMAAGMAAGAVAGAAGAAAVAGARGAAASSPSPIPNVSNLPDSPIPVPRTVTREALAGMGGAAATGGVAGAAAAGMARQNAPAPQAVTAQLVDVVTGETHQVTAPTCIIGRERAAANIVLRDPNVSRRHAQITLAGTEWSIEDLNSTNGTLVNNRRITRCPLRNGDVITFGLSTFEFRS